MMPVKVRLGGVGSSTITFHERVPFEVPRYSVEMRRVKLTSQGVSAVGCRASEWLQSVRLGNTERAVFGGAGAIDSAEAFDCTVCSRQHKALIQMPWDMNNFYEWYGDWVTLWETLAMLSWDPADVELFLIAGRPKSGPVWKLPFDEAWASAFKARGVNIGRRAEVFGPAGCCFDSVATVPHGGLSTTTFHGGRGGEVRCASPTLIASGLYLESLFNAVPCPHPTPLNEVTLLLRSGTRAFDNDDEAEAKVRSVLPAGWTLRLFRPEMLHSLSDQIAAVSRSRVLVGVHGAGMTHELFLPAEAQVVEIFCQDRGSTNHHYMNMETMANLKASRETHYRRSSPGGCRVDSRVVQQAIGSFVSA